MTAPSPHVRRLPSQLFALCGLGWALFACSGSVNASAKAKAGSDGSSANAEGDAAWDTLDESQSEEQTSSGATLTAPQAASSQGGAEMALLGARHDLLLTSGSPAPCACLAVALGQPGSPQFSWTGRRPTINPSNQTVIALSSDGVPCTEAGPGASYMGYEKIAGDVIVTVEAAVAGRPVTHGAIIPKPDPGKQIYVEPDGKIPYGRGKGGEPRCALGAGQ
jgi:hypothetical protein